MNPVWLFIVKYKTPILIILGLLLLWWMFGSKIVNSIKRAIKTKGQKQELSDVTTQITELQEQGIKPTYGAVQYSTWANQLAEAFDGCGTSNQVWRSVFGKMRNNLDVAILIDSYGVKTFDECNWEGNFGDFTGSLSEALVHELSEDELLELEKLFESNGLKSPF